MRENDPEAGFGQGGRDNRMDEKANVAVARNLSTTISAAPPADPATRGAGRSRLEYRLLSR